MAVHTPQFPPTVVHTPSVSATSRTQDKGRDVGSGSKAREAYPPAGRQAGRQAHWFEVCPGYGSRVRKRVGQGVAGEGRAAGQAPPSHPACPPHPPHGLMGHSSWLTGTSRHTPPRHTSSLLVAHGYITPYPATSATHMKRHCGWQESCFRARDDAQMHDPAMPSKVIL